MKTTAGEQRNRDVYRFIVAHFNEFGFPPSIREIGDAVGLSSTASVFKHLDRLEERGKIERVGTSRRIKLTNVKLVDAEHGGPII